MRNLFLYIVNMKPFKMKENKELISYLEAKETWVKPELETVSVKESTLATVVNFGVDGGIFS